MPGSRPSSSTFVLLGVLAAVLGLGGCATVPPDYRGTWVLTEAEDASGPLDLLGGGLELTIEDDSISGSGGCNQFLAEVAGVEPWTLEDFVVTEQACVDPEPAKLNERYLGALSGATSASLEEDVLLLAGPTGSLRYERG